MPSELDSVSLSATAGQSSTRLERHLSIESITNSTEEIETQTNRNSCLDKDLCFGFTARDALNVSTCVAPIMLGTAVAAGIAVAVDEKSHVQAGAAGITLAWAACGALVDIGMAIYNYTKKGTIWPFPDSSSEEQEEVPTEKPTELRERRRLERTDFVESSDDSDDEIICLTESFHRENEEVTSNEDCELIDLQPNDDKTNIIFHSAMVGDEGTQPLNDPFSPNNPFGADAARQITGRGINFENPEPAENGQEIFNRLFD